MFTNVNPLIIFGQYTWEMYTPLYNLFVLWYVHSHIFQCFDFFTRLYLSGILSREALQVILQWSSLHTLFIWFWNKVCMLLFEYELTFVLNLIIVMYELIFQCVYTSLVSHFQSFSFNPIYCIDPQTITSPSPSLPSLSLTIVTSFVTTITLATTNTTTLTAISTIET